MKIISIKDKLDSILKIKDKKKFINNLVIILVVGLIIIIVGGSFKNNDNKNSVKQNINLDYQENKINNETDSVKMLEDKMKGLLEQIDGAGNVNVMITLETSSEYIHEFNTVEEESLMDEKDSNGGTRNTNDYKMDKSIVFEEPEGGVKKPIIIKEIMPQVRGVVVVADGGGSALVKENICRAVETLLDVPVHKIQVFKRKK